MPKAGDPLLTGAVIVELAIDAYALVHSLVTGDGAALPGAIVRTLIVGGLGVIAVVRRAQWARWTFAGFQYLTAATGLLLAFLAIPGGQLHFKPGPFAVFLGYSALGIGATVGGRQGRRPVSDNDATPGTALESRGRTTRS